jgi:hypothetical protein
MQFRKSLHLVAAVVATLALAACAKEPTSRTATDNPDVPVETLFTHDGCTVYRFTDYGDAVHFAKCESGTATVSRQISCGKNCRREETTITDNGGEQ